MVDVLDESWFTSPMNERRSVRLEGVGNLAIACVMDGSIRYPSEERWKPAKETDGFANSHLDMLSVIRFSSHLLRNCLTCSVWCSLSRSYMTMSSTTRLNPGRSAKASSMRRL